MKQYHFNSGFRKLLVLICLVVLVTSCSKSKKCETNNTFTLTIKNTLTTGIIQVNIDKDFVSINGPGDYSVSPGGEISVDVSAGSHTIKARSVVSSCSGTRCSTTVTGKPDKTIDHPSCTEATLVY